MMPGDEAPTIELPVGAVQAIWRIFGSGLAPLKEPTCYDLAAFIIRDQVGETDEAERIIDEIRSWFDPDGGPNHLRQDMKEPVAEMIIDGIRVELSGTSGIGNHDTAFWAMGSINPDLAASIIRSSWSPEQMDSFARYAVDTLERLHGQGEIFDPKHIVGRDAQRARAHSVEVADDDPLRSFHVGSYIAFEAHRSMYPGIPSVVHLLLALNPEMLPELVGRVPDRLLQSLAALCVGGIRATSDHRKPLQWITDSSPMTLIALAILHVLEFARQAEIAGPTGASPSGEDASAPTILEGAIGDLVSSLEALGPARSIWWAFEMLNHTSFGTDEKRPTTEAVEKHCTQLLEGIVLDHWSEEVISQLESGLRRARLEPRGKPLADVAWQIREQEPEKAAQVARILLDENERRMTAALEDDLQSPELSGRWNNRDWLIAVAAAVVMHHEDIDPLDWAIEKCKALPLSAWDADEEWKIFHVADRVAQIQMTIALYAVQLLAEAGRRLDRGNLLAFAEQVWAHAHFVRRHSDLLAEKLGPTELAARMAAVFGEPDQEWALRQANSPALNPLALWALLDQMGHQESTVVDDSTLAEIRKIASNRYVNAVEVNPQSAPHLANLWVLLDAPQEAATTAEVLLTYHRIRANRRTQADRTHAIAALKMLAFAASRKELADDLVEASRSLYDHLWGQHTPADETHARQEIDAFLERTVLGETHAAKLDPGFPLPTPAPDPTGAGD